MPELIPAVPGSPEWLAARRAGAQEPAEDWTHATLAAAKAEHPEARSGQPADVDRALWAARCHALSQRDYWDAELRRYETAIRQSIGAAADISVNGRIVAHRIITPQHLKARDRMLDRIVRTGGTSR